MEQRSDSLNPVVLGAGTDPTHIPGLDDPATGKPQAADPDAAGESPQDDASLEEATAGEPVAEDSPVEDSVSEDDDEEPADDATDDGPVFEVSDRRSTIRADHTGVTFRLDDTEARIGWSEIGAVEIDTPRFTRRFAVTVYTTNHRHFDADVEAPSKRHLREWTADLDAALDRWFEAGAAK